jgi:hypothetical protein
MKKEERRGKGIGIVTPGVWNTFEEITSESSDFPSESEKPTRSIFSSKRKINGKEIMLRGKDFEWGVAPTPTALQGMLEWGFAPNPTAGVGGQPPSDS